ncbi:MAG: glycine cleavage system protein GcvH [Gammaproteobacteria bacterium]|jgi:glycine cleavage system H protein|nr:glycine cleavage system protein GcvH [Gammaproteobacteria bacterium]
MSDVPGDLKYSKDHEWVRLEEDGSVTVGVTDHAQAALGDMVFVELPEIGATLAEGDACAVVESVKAASDVYSPLNGEVTEGNQALADAPELVNQDPYGDGWIYRMKLDNEDDLGELMSAEEYLALLEDEA